MSWQEILSHQGPLERFQRSVEKNRLASTYLFVGPPGVGKRTFALKLAEALLCETNAESELNPCGSCPACQQVKAQSHPDLILVKRPKDKNYIPVETFIGDREHRRRTGLCHDIGLKPFRGGRKIAIIDDADFLNVESANSLLKTLEEPPPNSLLILIGTSEQRQLSTIVSRSQVIRFGALPPSDVETILGGMNEIESEIDLSALARVSQGSVELAVTLANKEVFEFRQLLFEQLASADPGSEGFTKSTTSFVDGAGKDAAEKRARLTLVADFAISFFRQWQQFVCNQEPTGDAYLDEAVASIVDRLGNDANQICQIASFAIQRTMDLQRHVAANVNNANAVASWLTDLGRIFREQRVPSVEVL